MNRFLPMDWNLGWFVACSWGDVLFDVDLDRRSRHTWGLLMWTLVEDRIPIVLVYPGAHVLYVVWRTWERK